MKLIFEDSNGKERVIAEVESDEQAMKKVNEFCFERGFKIYYTRCWNKGNRTYMDVGSHTEFFILERE